MFARIGRGVLLVLVVAVALGGSAAAGWILTGWGRAGFWDAFRPNFVATIGGVLVAVALAYLVERGLRFRERTCDELALLRAVRQAITFNLYVVEQAQEILEQNGAPSFSPDRVVLEEVAPRLARVGREPELVNEVLNWRYQLGHLDGRLTILRQMATSEMDENARDRFQKVRASTIPLVKALLGDERGLLRALDARIRKLERWC